MIGRMLPLTIAAAIALGPATPQGPPPPQQAQQPVFRSGVDTVPIYATVLDRYGEMVLNLTRADFDVFDNDKPQELTTFVHGLQPITAIVLLDRSASMTLNLEQSQLAAEQFIIRMLPGDSARIASFADRIDLDGNFLSDRDALLREMREELRYGNPTRLWDALDQTMTALAPIGGRRVIMLFTDGMDTLSRKTADQILERARQDELMIYVVQFRSTLRANLAELLLGQGSSATSRNPPPTEALRRLAAQTGGGHFLLGRFDDVNSTFTRVMQELHYQYVLGFAPQRFDGKIHNLTVRTTNADHVVRARRSYLAGVREEPR